VVIAAATGAVVTEVVAGAVVTEVVAGAVVTEVVAVGMLLLPPHATVRFVTYDV
jgi:hypothetical protein